MTNVDEKLQYALNEKLIQVPVMVKKVQLRYLKQNGINRSKFMRQAIEAHKDGSFNYKFIEDDEE